jgi:hypothetical protein
VVTAWEGQRELRREGDEAHLRLLEVHVDAREHGKSESSGFAGSRLWLSDHIPWAGMREARWAGSADSGRELDERVLEKKRKGALLNLWRLLESHLVYSFEQVRVAARDQAKSALERRSSSAKCLQVEVIERLGGEERRVGILLLVGEGNL